MKSLKELCKPRPTVFDLSKRDMVLDLSDLINVPFQFPGIGWDLKGFSPFEWSLQIWGSYHEKRINRIALVLAVWSASGDQTMTLLEDDED